MFCLAAFAARAAHTQVKLILSADVAKPGDTIWAGVDLKMEFGWHTYWKNPGAAGMATSIKWQLPAGVSAGEIQWPLPEKLPPIEVTTYGYENEVMLLVPLTIASNLPPGTIDFDLKANVSWLECKDVCIPQNQDVEAKLIVGNETKNSTNLATIDLWKKKVPLNTYWLNSFNAQVHWLDSTNNDVRRLIINSSAISNTNSDFFPFAYDNFEIQPDLQTRVDSSGAITLIKFVKKFAGDWPKAISGVLIVEKNSSRIGYEINGFPIDDQPPTNFAIQNSVENLSADKFVNLQTNLSAKSLWQYLLYAFIGGLILNIMPCVLPVIALKILGFVSEARNEPRRVRNLGFIYALGVLVSFLALAAVVIGVKAAGHHAGWGMQFGSPIFVVCLTTLVLLVALNLFGVFEITPGGKILNAAGQLASKHGAPGAFFNGVLATILATPCTAPFLSAALAFAFTQNSATILLIFLFVGIGLAAPYVLLSCNPALLKFLPKPGAWMEKFKIAIGFPMLATAVWLFNVAASDYGARVFWLGVFLVAVAFAAWIFGEFVQRGRNGKTIAFAVILIFLAGGYIFALENKLHWREMNSETGATNSLANSSNGIDWQQWSPQAVAQARADGKIVLVDFTATWCVTCNAIIKPALENDSVVAKLKEIGAATFLADYTRTPQNMTDEISKYGAGVPLVLIYPKNSGEPPMVLPQPSPLQLPSGYAKIVLDALDRAAD
ncbi:MAG TPA: protein-disulfide reductase DsbD domain-containing protein [Verrucomicrobiae bacterium]|nr:protein-disulfide reductase DsbD domain-containing protein [Verrucomicrobiae bacterium]